MSIKYSKNTQHFIKELNKITSLAHHESDRHLKKPSQLKGVKRLYEADTSKFAPTKRNREHLINTLMPMVVKIAKTTCKKWGTKIEFDDCISSGMQGAIIATDLYIEKSETETQPAKLSTYAYFYIQKYINEYCYSVNSILSHGPTKWWHASNEIVMPGNASITNDNSVTELFNILTDSTMTSYTNIDCTDDTISCLSKQLFSKLSEFDKSVIFLTFGIGSIGAKQLKSYEVAERLQCTSYDVKRSLETSFKKMQESIHHDELSDTLEILRSTDLAECKEWNM